MFDLLGQIWAFIRDPAAQGQPADFATVTHDFLLICLISIALSLVVALPVGVLVAQRRVASVIAANLSGLGRAIPTIALLALLLPRLGTGILPSAIALMILGIPPILLNTIVGLRGIDPAAVDAARGMGMTNLQILTRIRVPLVLPVVAAGARTSAVQIVATAPLASLIGAGGYGIWIYAGIGNYNTPEAFAGALPVTILALITEFGLATAQRALTPAGLRVTQQRRGTPVTQPGPQVAA
jgi:osmoprotectant transport system permease protein